MVGKAWPGHESQIGERTIGILSPGGDRLAARRKRLDRLGAARMRQGEPTGGCRLRARQAERGGRKPGERVAPDRLGAIGRARVKARIMGGAPGERGRKQAPRRRRDEVDSHTNCSNDRLEQGRAKADRSTSPIGSYSARTAPASLRKRPSSLICETA